MCSDIVLSSVCIMRPFALTHIPQVVDDKRGALMKQ